MTPELESLCDRLEAVESNRICANLYNNRYRNPDGPEAAAKLREMAGEIERLREVPERIREAGLGGYLTPHLCAEIVTETLGDE